MDDQVAIVMDGGFVSKRLGKRLRRLPVASDVTDLVAEIMAHQRQSAARLFRVFYYDCPPPTGALRNPLDGTTIQLGTSPSARSNQSLLDTLEIEPDFAVRRGQVVSRGWKLGHAALRQLQQAPRQVQPGDLVPEMEQKGVDLRMGLDARNKGRSHGGAEGLRRGPREQPQARDARPLGLRALTDFAHRIVSPRIR